MSNIILNYLLKNFFKTLLVFVIVFYTFGIILNLFEEIEYFKNLDVSFFTPVILTSIYIPSLIIKILPFIVFFASMWFMVRIRNNKNLLTLKIFGFSNFKIFLILAIAAFIVGWIVLFIASPISSSMSKYYEKTKSNYSKEIDHLITFNKNGLWIKENLKEKQRIITASKPDDHFLIDVSIFHLDDKSNLIEKIHSSNVNIKDNKWILYNASVFRLNDGILKEEKFKEYEIISIYNYGKINNLFKNFDTVSFLDLVFKYDELINNGYNNIFLKQNLHTKLTLPFFLFLMTALAAILTFNTLKKSDNIKFTMIGLITSIIIFYFKDLSLALGQTERIPLILSIWAPILALSFFIFIGVLQINEK